MSHLDSQIEELREKIQALDLQKGLKDFFCQRQNLARLILEPAERVPLIGAYRQYCEVSIWESATEVEKLFRMLGLTQEGEAFLTANDAVQLHHW